MYGKLIYIRLALSVKYLYQNTIDPMGSILETREITS